MWCNFQDISRKIPSMKGVKASIVEHKLGIAVTVFWILHTSIAIKRGNYFELFIPIFSVFWAFYIHLLLNPELLIRLIYWREKSQEEAPPFSEDSFDTQDTHRQKQEIYYLSVLGFSREVTDSEIKSRFKELVKLLHSDPQANWWGNSERLRDVIAAYSELKGIRWFK